MAEPGQFAVDSAVSHLGLSLASRKTSVLIVARGRWAPGRSAACVVAAFGGNEAAMPLEQGCWSHRETVSHRHRHRGISKDSKDSKDSAANQQRSAGS
jgi:hypothetical protein